jgi:hypothetical protein
MKKLKLNEIGPFSFIFLSKKINVNGPLTFQFSEDYKFEDAS